MSVSRRVCAVVGAAGTALALLSGTALAADPAVVFDSFDATAGQQLHSTALDGTGNTVLGTGWSPVAVGSGRVVFVDRARRVLATGGGLPAAVLLPAPTATNDEHVPLAASRDGATVVVATYSAARERTTLTAVDAKTGARKVLVEHDDVFGAAFSPDGRYVAYTSVDYDATSGRRAISVVPTAGGTVTPLLTAAFPYAGAIVFRGVAWSPDGTRLAYTDFTVVGGTSSLNTLDLAKRHAEVVRTATAEVFGGVAFLSGSAVVVSMTGAAEGETAARLEHVTLADRSARVLVPDLDSLEQLSVGDVPATTDQSGPGKPQQLAAAIRVDGARAEVRLTFAAPGDADLADFTVSDGRASTTSPVPGAFPFAVAPGRPAALTVSARDWSGNTASEALQVEVPAAPVLAVPRVRAGGTTAVSGVLRGRGNARLGGAAVELLARPAGAAAPGVVTRAVTGPGGEFRLEHRPARTTAYRVRHVAADGSLSVTSLPATGAVTSAMTAVPSRPTVARGRLAVVAGSVARARPGAVVELQRRTPTGRWAKVAVAKQNARGGYRVKVPTSKRGTLVLRTTVRGWAGAAGATSTPVQVRVR